MQDTKRNHRQLTRYYYFEFRNLEIPYEIQPLTSLVFK